MIQKMDKQDLPRIIEIEKSLFKTPWPEKNYLQELESNPLAYLFVVLNQKQQIVGYGDCWIGLDDTMVNKVSVDKQYQGQGYGNEILEHMIMKAIAAQCQTMSLEVRAANTIAQALYKKYGFASIAVRKKYYDDGEDAIVMLKNL